jgi:uncharacterized lipoprotein YddW (UPF0748 family)
MKKRIMLFFLCSLVSLALTSFAAGQADGAQTSRRGLFVTVVQEPVILSSREEVEKLVDFAVKARVDELFVQIYYAGRRVPEEDVFAFLIKKAHAAGIKVHAWLNILSLGSNKDALILKKYGPDILTRNRKAKRSIEDYRIDGQYFLEPGDERVREALSGVVGDVVRAYPDLDGVQFDYIRYPDTNPAYGYTAENMERYKKATGCQAIGECDKAWKEWKRDQVTGLLDILGNKARSINPGIQVSATGCMPYVRAYYEAFQDWPRWVDSGIVDFVTIMSYSPYPDEFGRWIAKAKGKVKDFRKVNIGLGAYKLAGSPGIFEKEFRTSEASEAGGVVIFHYGSLCEDPALADILIGGHHE